MQDRRAIARRVPGVELLERRMALSVSGSSGDLTAAAVPSVHHKSKGYTAVYWAKLTLAPGVASTDRASGFISLQLNHDASAINVTLTLSNISNVSAVVLHYTVPPAPPTVPATPPSAPATYQTVAVLLAPMAGSSATSQAGAAPVAPMAGSGPLRHITIHGPLNRFGLIGPLTGRPLTALIKEIQAGLIQVVVQTDNGVDGSTPLPGNYATGEIQGTLHARK
jgi:hypothetical protein